MALKRAAVGARQEGLATRNGIAKAPPPLIKKVLKLATIPGLPESGNVDDDTTILSSDDLLTLQRLALDEPVVRACTRILTAACLSSNIELRRGGVKVALQSQFERHLSQHFATFTADCIHALLCWGFVPVVLVPPPKAPFDMPDKPQSDRNLLPQVCDMSVAQVVVKRDGMSRSYELQTPQGDPISRSAVIVHDAPLHDGTVNSPMAALRSPLVGMQQLQENALQAEAVRSRLLIATQIIPRLSKDDPNIAAQNLFYDNESRAISSSNADEDDAKGFQNLKLAAKLAQELNRVSTTKPSAEALQQGHTSDGGRLHAAATPSPVPPALYTVPTNQQLSPLQPPQARTDLVEIRRQLDQTIGISLGVPALFVSEGAKFAASSASQLRSFNSRVHEISNFVSRLLTVVYGAIYPDAGDEDELVVAPSRVHAIEELAQAYKEGLVPQRPMTELAMKTLGFSEADVGSALKEVEAAQAVAQAVAQAEAQAAVQAAAQAAAQPGPTPAPPVVPAPAPAPAADPN